MYMPHMALHRSLSVVHVCPARNPFIPAGLDWVAQNAVKPAVVSLSLGVPAGQWSQPMEDAIKHLTDVVGIPVVVAAGNSAKDSCGVAPARVPSAITVAASNLPTKFGQTRAGEGGLTDWLTLARAWLVVGYGV
jgi:hypothetical protein